MATRLQWKAHALFQGVGALGSDLVFAVQLARYTG